MARKKNSRREPAGSIDIVMLIGASIRRATATPTDHNHGAGVLLISRQLRTLDRHQLDREAVLVPLAGLQRADTDHLTRDLLALLVGDRNDHAILALLAAPGMMNGPLDAHRRNRLSLRLRVDGVESQVMLAPRADVRALQDRRLAVRTYPRPAEGALASDSHR
jgi:hypothetical protein